MQNKDCLNIHSDELEWTNFILDWYLFHTSHVSFDIWVQQPKK